MPRPDLLQRAAVVLLALAGLLTPASIAAADTAEELQKRINARHPKIEKIKDEGKVGETETGYLEAVNGQSLDAKAQSLMEAENGDRAKVYALIAAKYDTDADQVAKQAAKKHIASSDPGQWVKTGGKWKRVE